MQQTNTYVEVEYGNINKAIKQYKESTIKYGIKDRLMEKKYYQKPSEIKRLQKQNAIFNNGRRTKK